MHQSLAKPDVLFQHMTCLLPSDWSLEIPHVATRFLQASINYFLQKRPSASQAIQKEKRRQDRQNVWFWGIKRLWIWPSVVRWVVCDVWMDCASLYWHSLNLKRMVPACFETSGSPHQNIVPQGTWDINSTAATA